MQRPWVEGLQWVRPAVGGHEAGHGEGSCGGHWLPFPKCPVSEEAGFSEKRKALDQLHGDTWLVGAEPVVFAVAESLPSGLVGVPHSFPVSSLRPPPQASAIL